jgi:hypothetical protein
MTMTVATAALRIRNVDRRVNSAGVLRWNDERDTFVGPRL